MDLSYSFEICRLCLIKSNNNFDTKMKNIFEYEGNIIEKIQKCTALQVCQEKLFEFSNLNHFI